MKVITIICLVSAFAATAFAATHEGGARGTAQQASSSSGPIRPGFSISGYAAGLVPGAHGSLRLKVHNPHRFDIRVTSIETRVGASATCPASNLSVRRFSGHKKVRARHSRYVRVRIAMAASAPDACQRATFPLTYKGRAVR